MVALPFSRDSVRAPARFPTTWPPPPFKLLLTLSLPFSSAASTRASKSESALDKERASTISPASEHRRSLVRWCFYKTQCPVWHQSHYIRFRVLKSGVCVFESVYMYFFSHIQKSWKYLLQFFFLKKKYRSVLFNTASWFGPGRQFISSLLFQQLVFFINNFFFSSVSGYIL